MLCVYATAEIGFVCTAPRLHHDHYQQRGLKSRLLLRAVAVAAADLAVAAELCLHDGQLQLLQRETIGLVSTLTNGGKPRGSHHSGQKPECPNNYENGCRCTPLHVRLKICAAPPTGCPLSPSVATRICRALEGRDVGIHPFRQASFTLLNWRALPAYAPKPPLLPQVE